MKEEKKRHVFTLNPKDNGGEQVHVVTKFCAHDDGEMFWLQELVLNCYGNEAKFVLNGMYLNPDNLIKLATELKKEVMEFELNIKAEK
jgi:hypothetical protein